MTEWKRKKVLDRRFNSVNTAEYNMRADSDGKILKVMVAFEGEKEHDIAQEEYELGNILQ